MYGINSTEKLGLSKMLKGGVIMDVATVEQAKIAEQAGACAVMALDMIPSDIRKYGGIARMADIQFIKDVKAAVSIPVMAKCRIGHFVEAQILENIGVDFIDESEVLTPADHNNHINKSLFKVPFVCGARNLGEALRRISEGAAMIRTKGEAGTGDISQAVKHLQTIQDEICIVKNSIKNNKTCPILENLRQSNVPDDLINKCILEDRIPVVNFAAGGVATPADATLMMKMGVDGIFVGSGIFKSQNPQNMAECVVKSVTHYNDIDIVSKCSQNCGKSMKGIDISTLNENQRFETR